MADTTTVVFESEALAPEKASILFRSALGGVTYLRDSLLGNSPKVFRGTEFDLKRHRQLRKFSTPETLGSFIGYLQQLVDQTPTPHPAISSSATMPIHYCVASGRAEISIHAKPDGWVVFGAASFRNPHAATQVLKKLGLTVTAETD